VKKRHLNVVSCLCIILHPAESVDMKYNSGAPIVCSRHNTTLRQYMAFALAANIV